MCKPTESPNHTLLDNTMPTAVDLAEKLSVLQKMWHMDISRPLHAGFSHSRFLGWKRDGYTLQIYAAAS